jgi:hypothetical protein
VFDRDTRRLNELRRDFQSKQREMARLWKEEEAGLKDMQKRVDEFIKNGE